MKAADQAKMESEAEGKPSGEEGVWWHYVSLSLVRVSVSIRSIECRCLKCSTTRMIGFQEISC